MLKLKGSIYITSCVIIIACCYSSLQISYIVSVAVCTQSNDLVNNHLMFILFTAVIDVGYLHVDLCTQQYMSIQKPVMNGVYIELLSLICFCYR